MVYLFLLFTGALGFVAMTVLGLGHGLGGHSSASHGASHAPAGHLHAGAGSHSGHGSGHHFHPSKGLTKSAHIGGGDPWKLLMAVSPIDIFSFLFGLGAAGVLLKTLLMGWELLAVAVLGGFAFALAIIRPYMGLMMRFASRPSEGLEGEVASIGEAISNFDHHGRGMVRLSLDEQIVQLLAYLQPDEIENGTKVRRGDQVVVVSVDAQRNTCTVSRELAPTPMGQSFVTEPRGSQLHT